MRLLDRYILRHVGLAFLLCLGVLTLLIWLIAALRQFDLLTAQGQTILVFLAISSLALPSLMVLIAPVALFIAILWSLNRLNSDSELVVMNASSLSPRRLALPYVALATLVAVLVGGMTLYAQPAAQRQLRVWLVKVGADVISKMVQAGQFTPVRPGIIVHVREKTANGTLLGVFVQDASNKDQTMTYIAERGQVLETNRQGDDDTRDGLFLILEKGSVQRQTTGPDADSAIVVFETYAFDLSQLINPPDVTFSKPRERFTSELLRGDDSGWQQSEAGRVRSELVDRFVAPLYPLAFALVALAALGQPRTTRQGRAGAIALAIAAIIGLRILGFFATQTLSVRSEIGPWVALGAPLMAMLICGLIITGLIKPHAPVWATASLMRLFARKNGSGALTS